MTDLVKEIDNAMQVVSSLSKAAREAGEQNLMYAANRAWHQLSDARSLLETARQRTSQLRQGEPR